MEKKHNIEVRAKSAKNVADSSGFFKPLFESFAKSMNILSVDPDGWMSRDVAFKSFSFFSKLLGPNALYRMGKSVGKNILTIKLIDTFDQAVLNLDKVYHLNHRQDGKVMYDIETGEIIDTIGHYNTFKITDNEFRVEVSSPYPCEFDRGLIEEYVRKYIGNKDVHVRHKPGSPCKKNGMDICSYTITILDF